MLVPSYGTQVQAAQPRGSSIVTPVWLWPAGLSLPDFGTQGRRLLARRSKEVLTDFL